MEENGRTEMMEKTVDSKAYVAFYKSIIDQDRASVVICSLKHEIIYMNSAAAASYAKYGGAQGRGKADRIL